jgi:hypothetical protein
LNLFARGLSFTEEPFLFFFCGPKRAVIPTSQIKDWRNPELQDLIRKLMPHMKREFPFVAVVYGTTIEGQPPMPGLINFSEVVPGLQFRDGRFGLPPNLTDRDIRCGFEFGAYGFTLLELVGLNSLPALQSVLFFHNNTTL